MNEFKEYKLNPTIEIVLRRESYKKVNTILQHEKIKLYVISYDYNNAVPSFNQHTIVLGASLKKLSKVLKRLHRALK